MKRSRRSLHLCVITHRNDDVTTYVNYENRECFQFVDSLADATKFNNRYDAMDCADTLGLATIEPDEKGRLREEMKPGYGIMLLDPKSADKYDEYPKGITQPENYVEKTRAYAVPHAGPVHCTTRRARNESAFKQWNAKTPSSHRYRNGEKRPLAASTQQVMRSHLNHVKERLHEMGCVQRTISKLKSDSIFDYSHAEDLQPIVTAIFADKMFQRNSRPVNHNYLRSALQRYLMFLEERNRR